MRFDHLQLREFSQEIVFHEPEVAVNIGVEGIYPVIPECIRCPAGIDPEDVGIAGSVAVHDQRKGLAHVVIGNQDVGRPEGGKIEGLGWRGAEN